MSVVVPAFPRPLQQLTVDPPAIAELGMELLAASARLDDAGELARAGGRLAMWEGEAAEGYRRHLEPDARAADAMSLALRGVGRRVEAHADAMRRLDADLDDLTVANRALVDHVFGFADEVHGWRARAARAAASLSVAEALAADAEGQALRLRADDLAARVRALDADQVAWWQRVVAEEAAMADALAGLLELDQVEQRYADATDPADEALATRPGRGAPPAVVLAWWLGLSLVQRRAVLVAAPGAVGNLDGIPAADRDDANRIRLARDLATLRHLDDLGHLTTRERATLENAEAADDALDRHADDVDAHGRDVPVLLWIYDPGAFPHSDGSVDGRVAIAVGDPDEADAIAINVPGIKTEAADIGDYTDRAWELHQAATAADPDRDYASIAWLGYDAPRAADEDLTTVVGEDAADRGGALLADSIDGLRALRGDDVEIVPIGHSYGSTTLGATLTQHDVDVDRAAVVGSPGLGQGIGGVEDLDLGGGTLYVGQNADDLVAGLGQNGALGLGGVGHGQDPADAGFGGVRFEANAGPEADQHSSYYANDSESLHNLGLVLAGQEPTPAGAVLDPWWWSAFDPEAGATADLYDTDGDGDVDGVPDEDRRAS